MTPSLSMATFCSWTATSLYLHVTGKLNSKIMFEARFITYPPVYMCVASAWWEPKQIRAGDGKSSGGTKPFDHSSALIFWIVFRSRWTT